MNKNTHLQNEVESAGKNSPERRKLVKFAGTVAAGALVIAGAVGIEAALDRQDKEMRHDKTGQVEESRHADKEEAVHNDLNGKRLPPTTVPSAPLNPWQANKLHIHPTTSALHPDTTPTTLLGPVVYGTRNPVAEPQPGVSRQVDNPESS